MRRTIAPLLALALLSSGCAADTASMADDGAGGSGTGGGGSSSSSSSSGGGTCTPTLSCSSRGYQCGGFTDSCGHPQACGTCGEGTACTKTDGSPGFCAIAGTLPPAGNPDGSCQSALPAAALPEDTSHPTTVVGDGTAASCTFARLSAAVATGGIITFRCGADPLTIAVTAPLQLRLDRHTVIDGGGKITLDGGHAVRILEWNGTGWQTNANVLTLQHLVLANGKATPTEQIPLGRPAPCSQGWNDGEGGALFMRDGALHAVDVTFVGNQAAPLGPDTGGGAVYLLGCQPAVVSRCSFLSNSGSNAGGIGALFAQLTLYDSLFDGNTATGNGANNDDASKCAYINNGQHEIGSGGNGGSIYSDGVGMNMTLCGTQVRNSHAGAFGAAVFFTSNDTSKLGTLYIRDSWLHDNRQDLDYWQWMPGISTTAATTAPVDSTIVR